MSQTDDKYTEYIENNLIAYLRDELHDPMLTYASLPAKITGGYETATYQFQLAGAPKELSRRLVLRLYPENRTPDDVNWESSVQNLLANTGFPAARVYFTCTDIMVLGGAFFIMAFLPGNSLWTAPFEMIPKLLGETHATLHRIDPEPLIKSLEEQGFNENYYLFRKWFNNNLKSGEENSWMSDIVDWLIKNRPAEPDRLVICHNDFHPYNILILDGKVSGVVDWHLCIADPALDVAKTIMLINILVRNSPGMESIDWDMFIQSYLDAYRTQAPLDSTNIDYYQVFRCTEFLYLGYIGNIPFLFQPQYVKGYLEFVYQVTGIRITLPDKH